MVKVEGSEETKKVKGLRLYHFAPSNASQKVRAVLEAKNLKWDSRILSRSEMESDWYFAIHPKGLVPSLVHDGVTHVESDDIMVYLDEAFPDIPLRPTTEEGRREVQTWLDLEATIQRSLKYLSFIFLFGFAAKRMETDHRLARLKAKNPEGYAFHKSVRDGSITDEELLEHIERIHDALQKVEAHLTHRTWFVGDGISLADYCWGPHALRFVERYLPWFPVGRYPAVRAWYQRLLKDEAFQKGVVAYGTVPVSLTLVKNTIQDFLGYSISCFEKEVKPNWFPALLATAALPVCWLLLPYASIAASYGVSSTVINSCLAALWAGAFYSAYTKAHTPTKSVYASRIHRMRALLVKAYGRESGLVCEDRPRPKVVLPDDVLVRVQAASVNPIDIKMKEGYGKTILNFLRRKAKIAAGDGEELPLILGRDCSGVVEAVGESVSKVKVGDEVWAAVSVLQTQGALAEYVMLKEGLVSKKPDSLTHIEAASISYVAVTTWAAVVTAAGLGPSTTAGKRVLILAGTGGVGSFAIQLVKAWGGHVTTSCSASGRDMVKRFGADDAVDYAKTDLESALMDKPRFDVVVDTLGPSSLQSCLNLCKRGGCVVTLVPPALTTLDRYGIVAGLPKVVYDLLRISIPQKLFYGRSFKYAIAAPSGEILDEVARLVDQKKIKPTVEKVFSLAAGNEAFEHLAKGHARGKTVVVMKPDE